MAAAAEEFDVVVAVGGGQVDFGGSVGRDDDGPFDAIAGTAPVALDGAADGAVGCVIDNYETVKDSSMNLK